MSDTQALYAIDRLDILQGYFSTLLKGIVGSKTHQQVGIKVVIRARNPGGRVGPDPRALAEIDTNRHLRVRFRFRYRTFTIHKIGRYYGATRRNIHMHTSNGCQISNSFTFVNLLLEDRLVCSLFK